MKLKSSPQPFLHSQSDEIKKDTDTDVDRDRNSNIVSDSDTHRDTAFVDKKDTDSMITQSDTTLLNTSTPTTTTLSPPSSSLPGPYTEASSFLKALKNTLSRLHQRFQTPYFSFPPRPIPSWHPTLPILSFKTQSNSSFDSDSDSDSNTPSYILYVYPPGSTLSIPSSTTHASVDPYCLIWQTLLHCHPFPLHLKTKYTSDYLISPSHTLPCLVSDQGHVHTTLSSLLITLTKLDELYHPLLPLLFQFLYPAIVYSTFYEPKNMATSRQCYTSTTKNMPWFIRSRIFTRLREAVVEHVAPPFSFDEVDPNVLYTRAQTTLAMVAAYLEEQVERHPQAQEEMDISKKDLLLHPRPTPGAQQPPHVVDVCLFAALHSILSQEVPMEKLRGHVLKYDILLRYTEQFVETFFHASSTASSGFSL